MTDTSTEAVTALLEGVTPGPWTVGPVDDTRVEDADGNEVALIDGDYNEPDLWPKMEANARFIAAARELVPALLAERDYLAKSADRAVARMRKAEDERDAAIARAVKIMALKWEKDTMPNSAPQRYKAAAHGGFGDYSVTGYRTKNEWQWYRNGYFVDGHQHHKPMPIEAAKAAAQADYEARILTALEKPHD